MKNLNTALFAAALSRAAVPAFAGHSHHGVWDRLDRQSTRIESGIDAGDLTRREAKELRKEHRKIKRMARKFREDGYLSKRERRVLRHRLDDASAHIWELRHNGDYRYTRHRGHDRWKKKSGIVYWVDDHGHDRHGYDWW